jgi:hypothetical protein
MIYDKNKATLFITKIEEYYKNLDINKSHTTVDVVLPLLIEESNKNIILDHSDIIRATIIWKRFAAQFIQLSTIKDKIYVIEILKDEIKFQNYLWNKKWKEYVSQ